MAGIILVLFALGGLVAVKLGLLDDLLPPGFWHNHDSDSSKPLTEGDGSGLVAYRFAEAPEFRVSANPVHAPQVKSGAAHRDSGMASLVLVSVPSVHLSETTSTYLANCVMFDLNSGKPMVECTIPCIHPEGRMESCPWKWKQALGEPRVDHSCEAPTMEHGAPATITGASVRSSKSSGASTRRTVNHTRKPSSSHSTRGLLSGTPPARA